MVYFHYLSSKVYTSYAVLVVLYVVGWLPLFILQKSLPQGTDKILHFSSFLGAILLCYLALKPQKIFIKILFIMGLLFVVAITSELIQPLFPHHTFDPMDIVFNILGGTTGLLLALLIETLKEKRQKYYLKIVKYAD